MLFLPFIKFLKVNYENSFNIKINQLKYLIPDDSGLLKDMKIKE